MQKMKIGLIQMGLKTSTDLEPAWVDDIAGAVKIADIPRRFAADAVDGSDKAAVSGGRGGLFKLP